MRERRPAGAVSVGEQELARLGAAAHRCDVMHRNEK